MTQSYAEDGPLCFLKGRTGVVESDGSVVFSVTGRCGF